MSVAIYYTSVRPAEGQERHIYGLNVAISELLKAYMRYGSTEKFTFLVGHEQEVDDLRSMAREVGVDQARLQFLDRRFPGQNFSEFDCVFRPEPSTRKMLWLREAGQDFAFCGLAHAISGLEAGDVLQEYILDPSRSYDAVIAPSYAVRSAISHYWHSYAGILNARMGGTYRCPVELPVIPLGITSEKFIALADPSKRLEQRRKMNVGDDDIVLLWVGRLSAAIKAHPLAMFQAAEYAAEQTSKKIHLVMVGYFVPAEAAPQFVSLASELCSKASVQFIGAHDPSFPDGLWAAGDIFLSLIDNVQESFGLTPIEAMAAGLPRVISDWDGYKDSVVDGEDGFLVPTTQPPPGNGYELTLQLASGQESYGGYLAKVALTVSVNARVAAACILKLIEDPLLYSEMRNRARTKAISIYDWKNIIPRYESLWRELGERSRGPKNPRPQWSSAVPQLPDPYAMYEHYATQQLSLDDEIAAALDKVESLLKHEINTYGYDTLISGDDIGHLIKCLASNKSMTVRKLFSQFSALEPARLWRTIGWLQKLGVIVNRS